MSSAKGQSVAGKRLSDFPEIAAQWHPTKNNGVTPDQVAAGSNKKYFWKCDKGPDHRPASLREDLQGHRIPAN
ncbi:MAG: zinc-ribbon domain-containing protein [Oxalobacteraceae bacterium]